MARRKVTGSVRRQISKNYVSWQRTSKAFEQTLKQMDKALANPLPLESRVFTTVGYARFVEYGGKWFNGQPTPEFAPVRNSLPEVRYYLQETLKRSGVYHAAKKGKSPRETIVNALNATANFAEGRIREKTPIDTGLLAMSWATRPAK